MEHLNITFLCSQCDYIARRKNILNTHIRSVHDKLKYTCRKCDFTAVSNSSVRRHYRRDHEKVRWNCEKCEFVTKFRETYKEHEELHASGKYEEKKKEQLKRSINIQSLIVSPVKKNICGKSNCCLNKNAKKVQVENETHTSELPQIHQ